MDGKDKKKCSKCRAVVEYRNGYCIDCFRKFGQPKRIGKRPKEKKTSNDSVENLVSSMKKQKKFGKLVTYSVGCLTKMAVDDSSVEELIEGGAIEGVMEVMGANADDENIAMGINSLIKASAVNPELTAAVCGKMKGQFGNFVNSLKNHVLEDTLVSTCQAMAALSKDPAGRHGLAAVGGIEAMAECLKAHPGNPEMVRSGAVCLSQFAKDPRYAQQIMDSGALAVLLEAMKKYPNDLELIEAAASLMASLAKASPEIAAKLKAMGAMDALVQALENHPFSGVLLQSSQEALSYMASEAELTSALGQITRGVVKADAKTAKTFSQIAALTLVGSNVDYMHKHDGIGAVLTVMKGCVDDKSKESSGILTSGARALLRMGTDGVKNYAIMKAGGVRLMDAALKAQVHDPLVAEAMISGLAGIMDRKDHAVYVGKVGGLAGVLGAIETHPGNIPIARAALTFFQGMAAHPESAQMLVEGKGVEGLVQILKSHIKTPDIVISALTTLAEIGKTEAGRTAMLDAGALPLLVQAINEHPESPDVIKAALRAMEKALQDSDAAEILRRAGAIDAISAALDRYPGDAELQGLGARVLKLLAEEPERKKAMKKAEEKRERLEDLEFKKKKAEQDLLEAEVNKNLSLWLAEEEKRKKAEQDRIRAYEEMKLREEELKNMKISDENKILMERRDMLIEKQKQIQEKRDAINKQRQDRVTAEEEKTKKKRDFQHAVIFNKYNTKVATGVQTLAPVTKSKDADGSDSDEDYEVN